MKKQDSNTFVIQTGEKREVTSIRVFPSIRDWFKAKCQRQGLSMCHITEALWTAYCMSSPDEPKIQQPPITINLKVERIVSKARRKGLRFEDVEIVEKGDLDSCFRCGNNLVTHSMGYYETPIRYIRCYACFDCFKFYRRNNMCLHWKEMTKLI